jgi:hypothetical protein
VVPGERVRLSHRAGVFPVSVPAHEFAGSFLQVPCCALAAIIRAFIFAAFTSILNIQYKK